jgi:hypothetical protein
MISAAIAALLHLHTAAGAQWPPAGTAEVRVFIFAGGPSDLIIKDNKVHPTAKPHGGSLLTKKQVESACAALNSKSKHKLNYLCFEPRDALVFYGADGSILASVSICFTCYGSRAVPNSLQRSFDYAALATFFASLDSAGGYKFHDASASQFVRGYRKKVEEGRARRAKAAGRPIDPEPWKLAKPSVTRRLSSGERVYIATNIPYDQFDGIKAINAEGRVQLNLCKATVMISGLTEVEASEAVRTAAIKEKLYNDHPSFTVSVVSARRFPTVKNNVGQQD